MEYGLVHASLAISVFGLLLLALACEHLEPPLSKIGDISTTSLGKNVKIRGNVSSLHRFEGGSILLSLRDPSGEVDVFIPWKTASSLPDLTGLSIEVVGAVELYEGRVEVVVEEGKAVRYLR